MGPPSPVQPVPCSSDVSESPLKRRKTNESMLSLARWSSNHNQTPSSNFSQPLPSPNVSVIGLVSPSPGTNRPQSGHDSTNSLDYAKLFSSSRLSGPDPPTHGGFDLTRRHSIFDRINGHSAFGVEPLPALNDTTDVLSPRFWNQQAVWPDPTLQEACLVRYFVENLAHWFDLCDPERHFALVVPQRARSCPPLLNAIFTASARHLSRLDKYKIPQGIVYQGKLLPDLKIETAIEYHNKCLTHLIKLSHDPDQVHDENLLAAAIILRFYEEVDAPLREGEDGDSELFLGVINIFVQAQIPAVPDLPHSSPSLTFPRPTKPPAPSNNTTTHESPASAPSTLDLPTSTQHSSSAATTTTGLRQAAFWVGFRQEIFSAFMKQRPFSLPLSRLASFRTLTPASDAVWADRLIVFCADVVQYCYGPEPRTAARYGELRRAEKAMSDALPASFEPIYYREALGPTLSEEGQGASISIFPQIWYLSDHAVAGIQHVELARILLSVYDPHVPRLGPGHVAALARLSATLQAIVKRLCGIAVGNRRTPPGLVTACMAIAMCGEHFTRREEQEALLGVLEEMEREHAWPERRVKRDLRRAWGW